MALGFRYPGVKPFSTEDKNLFFGRDADIDSLFKLIGAEQLVVLYSKSGLGKSSILNAGLTPKLKVAGNFTILNVRFGAYREGDKISPLETLLEKINAGDTQIDRHSSLKKDGISGTVWRALKSIQKSTGNKNILIILDQFEELFTYPEADIISLKRQLAEVLYVNIPQDVRVQLEEKLISDPRAISEEDLKFLFEPLSVKILMSIRSDKTSLLNNLKDYIPSINNKTFELTALDALQAENAILKPAYKREEIFSSQPFDISDDALDAILFYLTKGGKQKIESFQLQIICQYIETQVIEKKLRIIGTEHLGDINDIFENYYDNLISKLPTIEDQQRARVFIEEKLIYEEDKTRLSIYERQILQDYNVSKTLLAELVNSHLVRAEPNTAGAMSYELSHDTLVEPILKAKTKRLEKLKVEEEKKRIALEQHLAASQKRRLRNTQLLLFAISILACISIIAFFYDYNLSHKLKDRDRFLILSSTNLSKTNKNLQETKDKLLKQRDSTALASAKADSALKRVRKMNDSLTKSENENFGLKNIRSFDNSAFGASTKIDKATQNRARELCLTYLQEKNITEYRNTFDLLNKIALVAELSDTDPEKAADQIETIFKDNRNINNPAKDFINSIGLPLINKPLRKQEKLPDYDGEKLHTTSFAFSPDRTRFAYNVEENIATGRVMGDKLVFDHIPEFKHSPHLTSMGLNNLGEIVAREKGHVLYFGGGKIPVKVKLPVDSTAYCKLSPDGSMLFTLKDVPHLWKTRDLETGQLKPINFKGFDKTISAVTFSANNQLIALGYAGGVDVFDLSGDLVTSRRVTGNRIQSANGSDRKVSDKVYVTALNFSRDAKNIIVGTSRQNVIILNLSPIPTTGITFDFKPELKDVISVALSPDERHILAGAEDGQYLVLDIPRHNFTPLPVDTNVIYADFLNNNILIYAGYHGKITTYNIPQKFKSLSDAAAAIKPFEHVTIRQSLNRAVGFEDLMLSNDPKLLHDKGYTFQKGDNNKDSLTKAKQIFTRLVAITRDEPKYDYLNHLIEVNTALNELELKNYFANVDRLKENIILISNMLKIAALKDSIKTMVTQRLSSTWGNLAYNQLFIKDYPAAIASSQKGLDALETNDWIYTNLALGYLLSGDFVKAKAIYMRYKDKNIYQSNETFKKSFLKDIADLETEDVITTDDPEIYARVNQIKELLKR